jgi:hypothetical protein
MLRTSQKSVPLTYSMAEWLFQSRRWLLPRCSRDLKDSCCLHHVILSHKDLDTNIPKFKVRWLHYTKFVYIMSGCWFQTFFIFPYIGNSIIPFDYRSLWLRGCLKHSNETTVKPFLVNHPKKGSPSADFSVLPILLIAYPDSDQPWNTKIG